MGKTKVQKIGFLVGIVAMLVIGFMPTPEGMSLVGQRVLAVTVLMVVFWITEAMPIPFTALLPIFLFPVMQITGSKGQNDITLFAPVSYTHLDVYKRQVPDLLPYQQAMNIYEREYLSAMVASCGGDLRKAAGKMELHLSTLYRKLEKLGLKPPRTSGNCQGPGEEPLH